MRRGDGGRCCGETRGGGSLRGVNRLLAGGYQIHLKDCAPARAEALSYTVKEWHRDPERAEREYGWATAEKLDHLRAVRRLVVRAPRAKGGMYHGLLLSTLKPAEVAALLGVAEADLTDEAAVLHAYLRLYDLRAGAVEIEFKQDKQGLGLTKRNKKSFLGQMMVQLLGALAHNVLVWAKAWLSAQVPRLQGYGALRLVRDVFTLAGWVETEDGREIKRIVFAAGAPLIRGVVQSLKVLLKGLQVKVILGEI